MRLNKTKITWVTCSIVAIALAAVGMKSSETSHSQKTESLPTVELKSPLSQDWTLGTQRTYDYATSATIDVAGAAHNIQFTGKWLITVVDKDAEQVYARCEVISPTVSVNNQKDTDGILSESALADLLKPFYVSFEHTGKLTGFYFEPSIDPFAKNLLKSNPVQMQWTTTEGTPATWHVREFDTTGEYSATYNRSGDNAIHRSKNRYTKVSMNNTLVSSNSPTAPVVSVKGSSDIQLGDDGWVTTLTLTETTRIEPGENMPVTNASIRSQAHRTDSTVNPSFIGSFQSNKEKLTQELVYQGVNAHDMKQKIDRDLVDGLSLQELLKLLHTSIESQNAEERIQSLQKLEALLRIDPKSIQAVKNQIVADGKTEVTKGLLGALGSAGTPEAQAALGQIVNEPKAEESMRTMAAISLGTQENPTEESASSLLTAVEKTQSTLRNTSALALGSQVRHLESGSDIAGDAVTQLITLLENATSVSEQIVYLKALGNAGDMRALSAIMKRVTSDHAQLRAVAVSSLRYIEDGSVDQTISALMPADPALQVRKSAVHAASFRSLEPIAQGIEQTITSESDEGVRSALVSVLAANLQKWSRAADLLRWVAQHDSSEKIRNQAKVALAAS